MKTNATSPSTGRGRGRGKGHPPLCSPLAVPMDPDARSWRPRGRRSPVSVRRTSGFGRLDPRQRRLQHTDPSVHRGFSSNGGGTGRGRRQLAARGQDPPLPVFAGGADGKRSHRVILCERRGSVGNERLMRVLVATVRDPQGRAPAPDSYTASRPSMTRRRRRAHTIFISARRHRKRHGDSYEMPATTSPPSSVSRCPGPSDASVYAVCVAEHRALVTLDSDFANPFRFDPAHGPGAGGQAVECILGAAPDPFRARTPVFPWLRSPFAESLGGVVRSVFGRRVAYRGPMGSWARGRRAVPGWSGSRALGPV